MSFAKVYSGQPVLLEADIITVEADISKGLHSFSIVGLPDKAVEESRDRVAAAVKNSGFVSPKSKNQKITISLAPADIKKEGPLFDVGIALCYLSAAKEIAFDADGKLFLGELALDSTIRPVHGVLPIVRKARQEGFTDIFLPVANAAEGALIDGVHIYGAETLADIIGHINTKKKEGEDKKEIRRAPKTKIKQSGERHGSVGFEDIRGQETAKRGLEIAAAGGHNIVLSGPPGTGKTMLARAFQNILPELNLESALEVTAIHSVAGTLRDTMITEPPFRAPHHTASYTSLVGGGSYPKPGEVTLAHRGVLFLDEFPEFERRAIDALRQPLEDRIVSISRVKKTALFPANFILVAAMNPHPDGGADEIAIHSRNTYRKKISGPIVDRIDLWITVPHIEHELLSEKRERKTKEKTETDRVRARVARARDIQHKRFKKEKQSKTNSMMGARDIEECVHLSDDVAELMNRSAKTLRLSPRSYHRVIKVARTIADLETHEHILTEDILEALQYRPQNMFE